MNETKNGEQIYLPGLEPPEPPTAEAIKEQLPEIRFKMESLRSPGDALINRALTTKDPRDKDRYKIWYGRDFAELVNIVAQETGADPAQIADKDRRTQEQEHLLTEAAVKAEKARIDAYFDSAFIDAINTLEPIQGSYNDPGAIDFFTDNSSQESYESGYISIKEQAALYFFALHGNADPTARAPLNPAQAEELQGIFARLDAFYQERTGGDKYPANDLAILYAFIEQENPAKTTAAAIIAKLPLVQGITPRAHIMPINPLMNALQERSIINAGEQWIPVSKAKGKRGEITAFVIIEYDPGETGIKIVGDNLTEYERQISNAVMSLCYAAEQEGRRAILTPDMIYRAMPGGSDKASPQQKAAIVKAVKKLQSLRVYYDASDEAIARKLIPPGGKYIFDENYLNTRGHTVQIKNGGATVRAVEILSTPIILKLSLDTKQLATIPPSYLTIEKVKNGKATGILLPMTANRQAMTGYLLRRIAVMKRDRQNKKPIQSPVILFKTLFADTGLAGQDKKTAFQNRDFIFQVLDYQKAVGNIEGYEKQQEGQSITGVKILL